MTAYDRFLSRMVPSPVAHCLGQFAEVGEGVSHDGLGLVPYYLAAEILGFVDIADNAVLDQPDVVFGEAFLAALRRDIAEHADNHHVNGELVEFPRGLWWQHRSFLSLAWGVLRGGPAPERFLAAYGGPEVIRAALAAGHGEKP